MLIPLPSYAPVRVTSVQLISGAGTNEIRSEPPPGWIEYHRYRVSPSGNLVAVTRLRLRLGRDLTSEVRAHNENALEEIRDLEDRGPPPLDLADHPQPPDDPHPPLSADSEPKVREIFQLRPALGQRMMRFLGVRLLQA